MSREPLNPDLANVESVLAGLRPSRSGLDRDRLMFLAGQAAGLRRARRAAWLGAGASTAATLAACVLGVLLLQRPGTEGNHQTAHAPAVQPEQPNAPSWAANPPGPRGIGESLDTEASYLELRQLVLTRGVDAMPEIAPNPSSKAPHPAPAPGQRQMLGHLLEG